MHGSQGEGNLGHYAVVCAAVLRANFDEIMVNLVMPGNATEPRLCQALDLCPREADLILP